MQQLEDQVRSICSSASAVAAHISSEPVISGETVVPSDEKCSDGEEGEEDCEQEEES
jgi:hypothetical protein